MSLRLATGPVSWGVDFAGAPGNPPWPTVLDGVRDAGYAGVELGPLGYLPADPGRLSAALEARGLALTGGFIFEPLHRAAERERIVAVARRVAELVAAVGGRYLVVIDFVDRERSAAAGRVERAPAVAGDAWRELERTIGAITEIADAAGLQPAVHPHAGTHVEYADEIERVAVLAPLCLDTGHLAYARLDPAEWLRRVGERVVLLHLKDLDAAVLERGLEFWAAVAAGVFRPLGTGSVDLDAIVGTLGAAPQLTWATVEQDRRSDGDPVADLIASRQALEAIGLGAPA